jgi:XTP/dITP diphosphohydrolase
VKPELIFATSNPAKLAQMAFVIRSLRAPVELVSAADRFGEAAVYEEIGNTAAAVAQYGAQTLARSLSIPVVVEDTTLHVEALNGEPGVRSGRYLNEHGRTGILDRLSGCANRRATIVSAVAWASPQGNAQTWVTALDGHITEREIWTPGMPGWVAPTPDNPLGGGYNAIFIPDGSSQTLAQIPPEDAIQLGYREPNFCAVVAFIQKRSLR